MTLPLGASNTDHASIDSPKRDIALGVGVIAAFFAIFLIWSSLAQLDAGAYAQGEVAVSGNSASVQHRDGGVISALDVVEGQEVTKGQVLLQLAPIETLATERGLTAEVFSLLAQKARLDAERAQLRVLTIPAEFHNLSVEDQALAAKAVDLQKALLEARLKARSTETSVLSQRAQQQIEEASGLERQLASVQEQERLINDELTALRGLMEKGFAPLTRVRALERTAAVLKGEEGALRAQLARARSAIAEANLTSGGVNLRLNEEVADQLKQIDVQLNKLQPQLQDLRDSLERHRIRAPVSGRVVDLKVFTTGGVVQPGQTLMKIVPDDASQVIIASVSPMDIDNLRLGLDTKIQFPSLRESAAPILIGQVQQISADSVISETDRTGTAFYRVEIVVSEAELAKLGPSAKEIRPGTPVEVVVVTRKRSLLQYLTEPLTRSLFRSGSEG